MKCKIFLSCSIIALFVIQSGIGYSQTLSQNLLMNPGAESKTEGWVNLAGTSETSSTVFFSGNNSFQVSENKAEQKVDVTSYISSIDEGTTEAFIGGWVFTYYFSTHITLGIRFLDSLGFEISTWEQSQIQSYNAFKEVKYRVKIPKLTRQIAFSFYSSDYSYIDDLSLQLYYTPVSPTPTPTSIVPLPTPTIAPTFTPQPSMISPVESIPFSEGTAAANKLLYFPPGAPGEYNLGDVFFRPLTTSPGDETYTDGFGISATLDPGEVVTFYGNPISVENDYVYLRVSSWTTELGVSLALGALDATPSDNIAQAALNGSIEANILMDASRFKNKFGYLEVFYKPERGAIVPVFQAVVGKDGKRATLQFDNLEIYRIPKNLMPSFNGTVGTATIQSYFRIGERILSSP